MPRLPVAFTNRFHYHPNKTPKTDRCSGWLWRGRCWLTAALALLGSMASNSLSFAQQEAKIEQARAAKQPDQSGWINLLPEKGLEGWEVTDFYGHGEVKREGDVIILERGKPLTGINLKQKEFQNNNYEVELEARRIEGKDFLCGLTFPIGKQFATFIGGGWGGGLVGLSSVNGSDASENNTSSHFDFQNKQWYKFRIVVDDEFVRGFIDKKEVFAQEREDCEFSTRIEVYASQPLGFCVFDSRVELKNFRWRPLAQATN